MKSDYETAATEYYFTKLTAKNNHRVVLYYSCHHQFCTSRKLLKELADFKYLVKGSVSLPL